MLNFGKKIGVPIAAALLLAMAMWPSVAPAAKSGSGDGEILIPGIWVDPDGCEHWVMDDGWEGFMSPVVTPDGKAVCGRDPAGPVTCGLVTSDQFFATDEAELSASAIASLKRFFKSERSRVFVIEGHTDSRASDAYNDDLSGRRAMAVANVGKSVGAKIQSVRALGERQPRATNATSAGRAMNRRVEIMCVR